MSDPDIHLPHRAVLALRGPDTITLLERLVTHNTADWMAGTARYGALLTPQGKVIADFLAARTQDGVMLDVDRGEADALAKRLRMFRLRSDVEIELTDLAVVARAEPSDAETAPDAPDGSLVFSDPRFADGRWRMFAPREAVDAGGALSAYHADRMANGIPEQGADFGNSDVFPADINMDVLGGIDLKKGCFVGQEVVSRMHRRGKIRRRTVCLELGETAAIEPGAPILAPNPIGEITSAQDGLALAQVRIDRWAKAGADGADILVHDKPVRIRKPDWLEAEMAPLLTS